MAPIAMVSAAGIWAVVQGERRMVTPTSLQIFTTMSAVSLPAATSAWNSARKFSVTRSRLWAMKALAWSATSLASTTRHGSASMSPRAIAAWCRCCPSMMTKWPRAFAGATIRALQWIHDHPAASFSISAWPRLLDTSRW